VRALRRSPRCTDQIFDRVGPLGVSGGKFAGGMSSSPIVSPEGAAIGVVSVGSEIDGAASADMQGPNLALVRNLPGWLLAELRRIDEDQGRNFSGGL